jgi:hypothetical protein
LQNLQPKERDQQSCKICNQKREINKVTKFVTKRERPTKLQILQQRERERESKQERLQILQKQKREQNNLQQKKMENLVEEGGRR